MLHSKVKLLTPLEDSKNSLMQKFLTEPEQKSAVPPPDRNSKSELANYKRLYNDYQKVNLQLDKMKKWSIFR